MGGGSVGVQLQEHENPRMGLFAGRGMPGLDLAGADGYETQIGEADLKYPASGETRRTSAASMVMPGNGEDRVI